VAPEVLELAKWVAAVGGALLVVWQLLSKVHRALVADMSDHFASKEDLGRLEKKIDTIVSLTMRGAHRKRGQSNE
jgi:hypothetical protein